MFLHLLENVSSGDFGCPGRALRVQFTEDASETTIYNLHVQDLSPADVARIVVALRVDRRRAREQPLLRLLVVNGDFNVASLGVLRRYIAHPLAPVACSPPPAPYRKLFKELGALTEITTDAFTHYDPKGESLTTIDRIFTSLASWVFPTVTSGHKVVDDPRALQLRGVSDHAPVLWKISSRIPFSKGSFPIPSRYCRCKAFTANRKKLEAAAGLRDLLP